jgi:hypothetical protein
MHHLGKRIKSVAAAAWVIVAMFASAPEVSAQAGRFELFLKASPVVPSSNFTDVASAGFGGGGGVGYWYSNHLMLQLNAGYHKFGEGTASDAGNPGSPKPGETSEGEFVPLEIGWQYFTKEDARGLYITLLFGLLLSNGVSSGDAFQDNHGDFSLGLGWRFPVGRSGTRLIVEAEYRSEISRAFYSYLVFNAGISFRL